MDKTVARLNDAPEEALCELYEQYAALVYACAGSVLARFPKEETEECMLDVFSYVYAHRAEIDDTVAIKAYLCRVAKSMAIDRIRKLSRRSVIPLEHAERLADSRTTEDCAEDRAKHETLVTAIHALGKPDAALVVWRYYFGMSTKEIARQTGMKENTVDQRLRRARLKLQNELKGARQYGQI